MFEGFVASIFNKLLGKYVEDLDTEHLNVGIFHGEVRLNNLNLKPEALFELELPIEVKFGVIGTINLSIPWATLSSQAIVVHIEDVLIVCTPVGTLEYNAEREKRLMRALKGKILRDLEGESFLGGGSGSLFDDFLTALTNNVQIYIRKVHLRYEDEICGSGSGGVTCGLCVEGLSVETTNSKWKPNGKPTGNSMVYQLAKLEAASVYLNPNAEKSDFLGENWRADLKQALETFSINGKNLDFVVKPFSAKMKAIISRSTESRVPKLLVDLVVHDIVFALSRAQLHAISDIVHMFRLIHLRREFLSFRPVAPVAGNASLWWKYFYEAVLQQRVRPYYWKNIQKHRAKFRIYKELYRKSVLNPADTELRLDLARAENNLPLSSIVMAREQGKIQIRNEDPDKIEIVGREDKWWNFHRSSPIKFQIRPEKPRGIWAQLSSSERKRLTDLRRSNIGVSPEKAKKYIEHKINLTIHHISGSLFMRGVEFSSGSVSQFLGNFETRPAANAFKVSARAENVTLDGSSIDQEPVPLLTVVPVQGSTSSNFLRIDFEKNPLGVEADYGLTVNMEQMQVNYHDHAFSQFLNFFQGIGITQNFLKSNFLLLWSKIVEFKKKLERRELRVDLNMSVKGPLIIVAENGSFPKSGCMTVLGCGKWTVRTDLQPPLCLDDLTQTELDERLYDRLHITLDGFQMLFTDSGNKWQNSLELDDSEHHVFSKVRGQIVLSNSIKPDYKLLPKYKLNIALNSVKVKLSDRRLIMLIDFFERLPLPSSNIVSIISAEIIPEYQNDLIKPDVELDLNYLKNLIISIELLRQRTPDNSESLPPPLDASATDLSSFEISDEDIELWARMVDLPGFDDNVSPHNVIASLLRFTVGEFVLVLSRSSDACEKPYLMTRFSKFRFDAAYMNYGPAIQATLGGIQLIDKLYVGSSGEFLEIVSTQSDQDFISLLYRKVRSDCPDFKNHFHSVEQSLVLDIGLLSVTFHKEATLTFTKYLQYLRQKIPLREVRALATKYLKHLEKKFQTKDPPIPPGAVKFSYSTHLTEFRLRLCDAESEFLEIKVKDFESDCMFKANERMILRAYLAYLSIDDLSSATTYPKILSIEEDKVFELKYVRHSPRLYDGGLGPRRDDVHSDGSLKLTLERIQTVIIYKMIVDFQRFIEPLISIGLLWHITGFLRKSFANHVNQLKGWNTRLHLSLLIKFPVLLLPEKSVSPNLFVLYLGELSVENFFKEVTGYRSKDGTVNVIDNVLLKLESASLSRALMTLTGRLEIRENVLEPIRARFDVKRFVGGPKIMYRTENGSKTREIPLFEIDGNLEPVKISLGQKDISTFFSLLRDNFGDRKFLESSWWWRSLSPIDGRTPTETEDLFLRKLQAFLGQSDSCRKDIIGRFLLESVTIDLYSGTEEVLSSPVRDANNGLCRFTLGEVSLLLDKYYDGSIEIKMALQTCLLEDIRTDSGVIVKRVLQSRASSTKSFGETISISTPPIIDVTFKQTQTGDRCVDILVEKLRFNLSVAFVGAFVKFLMDSIPVRKIDRNFINTGCIDDLRQRRVSDVLRNLRLPLSNGSTSGHYSSTMSCAADEHNGLSLSLQCRKPEVVVFSTGQRKTSALLFRCELLIEWSKHSGTDTLVVNFAGFEAWSKSHPDPTSMKQKTSELLNQCDVEIVRNVKGNNEGAAISAKVSPLDLRLSVATVATIAEIIQEAKVILSQEETKNLKEDRASSFDLEDLWSPKKISSHFEADECASRVIEPFVPQQPSFPVGRPVESLSISIPKISVILDVPQGPQGRPLFLVRSSFKLSAYDWSSCVNMKGELQLEAAYHNEDIGAWEPFIEPCNDGTNVSSRPWELAIQVFQGKSFPISPHITFQKNFADNKERKASNCTNEPEDSETSADESDQGMTFLKRQNVDEMSEVKRANISLGCGDSSESSEDEDAALDKLTKAIGHLFTDGNSEVDMSESVDTSATEDEAEEPEEMETEEETCSTRSMAQERAVFLKKHYDSIDSGLETEAVQRLAVHVLIHSKNRLEITVTPLSVKVLQEISNAFSGNSSLVASKPINSAAVKNFLGSGSVVTLLSQMSSCSEAPISVAYYDRDESPPSSPSSLNGDLSFASDDAIDFGRIKGESKGDDFSQVFHYPKLSLDELYDRFTKNRLLIEMPGFKELKIPAPNTSGDKIHVLQSRLKQSRYHIVLSAALEHGFKKYIIRSPLRVQNCTSYALEIFYKKSVLEELGEKVMGEITNPFEDWSRLAIIEPDDILNVPLLVAYHCKLHLTPAFMNTYNISDRGLSWHEMVSDYGAFKDICCSPKKENDATVFSLRACCKENYNGLDNQKQNPSCTIQLLPPITVENFLPYAIELKLPNIQFESRIEAGDNTNIYLLDIQKPQKIVIEVPQYLGINWTGAFSLTPNVEEKSVTMTTEQETDGGNKQLSLSLAVTRNPNVLVRIYSSYWIVNKTGLPLQIRGSLVECIHECAGEGPLLFGFRKQRRRCVRLRAFSSSWSSAFSMDAPGSSGLVICKDKERKRRYNILVNSHFSQTCPSLTKIITFLPNFLVTNACRKHLRFMEDNEKADLWIDIAPGQCLEFWPETDSMRMFVKFRDSKHISQHFPITISHTTVLRMDKGCGLTVEVSRRVDQPFSIRFQNYKVGDAPVRIDNQCEDLFLKFHQKESGQVVLLSPYQSLLYTWDDPSKERSLLWNVYNNKARDFCVPFWKDGFGEEKVSFRVIRRGQNGFSDADAIKHFAGLKRLNSKVSKKKSSSSSNSDDSEEENAGPQLAKNTRRDKIIVYWASYLHGRQRILLLTQDEKLAKRITRSLDAERSHLELFVSIPGAGFSLINKNKKGIPRELAYFSFSDSAAQWEVTVAHRWKTVALELASWLEEKHKQGLSTAQLKDYIHIDFDKMQMTKPFFGELRRKHRPAIWIQYRRFKHMSLFHFQLHRFQIDNQLHESQLPTILSPVPPPSKTSKCGWKPAIEIAYLKKHSTTGRDVYKFVKVVIQEHRLQIEKDWLAEISEVYSSWSEMKNSNARMRQDIALVHAPISSLFAKSTNTCFSETMFEYLHCSPIKLQIVFSSQSEHDYKENRNHPLIEYFLSILTHSLAQVKSITIKLLCFEIIGRLCHKDLVWNQAIEYFKSQFWQQLHVSATGINVLTNPYCQYLDFHDDSHPLFYEPYLENTGVPEEYSDNISVGALGLLGHETRSRSGTATLFATLLGTALQSVVQTDDNSKKNHSIQPTENEFPDFVNEWQFNFSAVCHLAASGVVVKDNAANGPFCGIESFFRGAGKGLMGLMTKSTGGTFNCLSMIVDGVKRAIEMGENFTSRIRPPRYVNYVLGLRTYRGHEARGLSLLKYLCKGLYGSDTYWAHAFLTPEFNTILLVTLEHIFLIRKSKSWGAYELVWILRMDDLMAVPSIVDDKLIFTIKQEENSSGDWNDEKNASSTDKQLLQWLKNQIESALVITMEDKPCI